MMPRKAAIIEQIGQDTLLLPELVSRAWNANDRLTYYLTLLQAARDHASTPRQPAPNLRAEREASGVANASFDRVVEESREIGADTLHFPGAGMVVEHLFDELRLMLQPLKIAGGAGTELRERLEIYSRRFDHLIELAPPCPGDELSVGSIGTLTSLAENGHDTVHQLALDLRWELNRLQASLSMETVDGARVYNVTELDRTLVRAFMKGINETAGLKFDHPGLDTTATHDGDRLSIQNDIGTTNAHVIVIHVAGLTVTVNYTDAHRPRLQFFHDLLQPFDVKWSPTTTPAEGDYEISVGQFTAEDPEALERSLTSLGSRLVFLIDWNRARKRLARLVRKSDAVDILKWAADNNIGHRAFLETGDLRLIDSALERAAHPQIRPGARLDETLGRQAARLFLMAVLQATSSGLRAGYSLSLIEDEVEAELLRHLETTDRQVLRGAADHATAISALADRLLASIRHLKSGKAEAGAAHQTADLAKAWSARADQIASRSGRLADHVVDSQHFRQLLLEAGRAADALEETAFMLTLVPAAVDSKALSRLDELADIVGSTTREYVRCLENGRGLSPGSARADVEAFLIAIDRLVDLNRQASATKRALIEKLLRGPGDYRDLYVIGGMASGFEEAANALARCGLIVKDHVLNGHSASGLTAVTAIPRRPRHEASRAAAARDFNV
jgi:hypothetical protein